MAHIALGHRRTGLCPTFSQPTLQRDGYLLRVPLVGGLLDLIQLDCLADVARQSSSGIVEFKPQPIQKSCMSEDSLELPPPGWHAIAGPFKVKVTNIGKISNKYIIVMD